MAKTENGIVSGTANGTVVEVEAGQNILLDAANADLVAFSQDGSNLVVTSIANGSSVVLDGFFSQASTDLPPQLTLADGTVITAAEVTGLVETFDPSLVLPAAGPGAGGAGGGANFSAYSDDGIGDGIGISNLLDPTELGFSGGEPSEFFVPLPSEASVITTPDEPSLLLNEIGLGSYDFDEGDANGLFQTLSDLNDSSLSDFLALAGGDNIDYIELRNNTTSDQSTQGNGGSTQGFGTTTLSIIGPNGDPVTFELPEITVPAGGHIVIMQADGESGVETIYVVFNDLGEIVDQGDVPGADTAWPFGTDTTEPLGVLLSWSFGGDVSQIDTFLANGASFEPSFLNDFWTGSLDTTTSLDIFGDSDTFNGQMSTQEVVSEGIFDAYAPITLAQLVECSPIAESFFLDISVTDVFSRVDNFDSDSAADWTTGLNDSLGLVNDVADPNPQDPFNDDMNPGQGVGPEALDGEDIDNNGQNVIVVGTNSDAFTNLAGVVQGGAAQDFLIGDDASNSLEGGAHNDFLDGGAGNDQVDGGSGGDVIIDDKGNDILIGGTGTDVIFGRRGAEAGDGEPASEIGNEAGAFDENAGDLLIGDEVVEGGFVPRSQDDSSQSDERPFALLGVEGAEDGIVDERQTYMRDIIVAGDGSDIIYGDNAGLAADFTPADIQVLYDTIMLEVFSDPMGFALAYREFVEWNYGGADLIYGGWGNDIIFGQGGDDAILAGHGDDVVAGGSGADKIRGNDGDDSLSGDTGNDTMFGDAGADAMLGLEDDDLMSGGTGNDTMLGGTGDDTMSGDADEDLMFGGAGDDSMSGGTGNDTMYGDADNDTMDGDDGADLMFGGSGDDSMFGGAGNDDMSGGTGNDTMSGGSDDDLMYGNDDDDVMDGGTGADFMSGDAGADSMLGGAGNDYMSGGTGNDTMSGNDDDDRMYGNEGADLMYGDAGNDFMDGGSGNDDMSGGTGNDFMLGGSGNDVMSGDDGNDVMYGQDDNDIMDGGSGADYMSGDAGADSMVGGSGNDFMLGGTGNDVMSGDDGDDVMLGQDDNDIMDGGSGADLMYGDSGDDLMYGGIGNDTMSGGDNNDTMYGNSGDDVMNGNAGADLMYGGSGSFDIMRGGAGNDVMFGDNGDNAEIGDDDIMYGGTGNDIMSGEGGADTMFGGDDRDSMSGGAGNDVMHGDNGETEAVGGSDDDTMSGGAGNDTMYGDDDGDLMRGNAGDDVMYGEDGNGSSFGGGEDDTMYGNAGNDRMFGEDEDDVMYGGTGNDYMSGGVDDDEMYGNAGEDTMFGDDGNDTMAGGAGEDTMSGGAGRDSMSGGANNDLMSGNSGADHMHGDRGDDMMFGGAGNDTMSGGAGRDSMSGGADNDLMFGDRGADDMSGNSGADVMYGGRGADDMSGGAGNDLMFGGRGGDDMSGGADNDLMYGGRGGDDMSGDGGDDVMFGEDGNDTMSGGSEDDYMDGGTGNDTMSGGDGNDILSGDDGDDTLRWTMSDNVGSTVDNYDGQDGEGDTLELYFTQAEFELPGAEEAIAEFANRVERGDTTATLEIGGKTLTASNFEHVAVHVDNVEIPILLDDLIVVDENADVIATITDTKTTANVDTPDQDFVPNEPVVTTFDAPKAVELTMPNGGPDLSFAADEWKEGPDNIWTLKLLDDGVDYGVLTFDATASENVTVKLDVPDGDDTIYDPMDDGDVATIVFDYSASVEGSEDATVTININGVNDAPVANDDIVITNTLGEIYIPKYALLDNDTDIENDPLQVDSVTPPASMHEDYDAYVRTISVDTDGNRVINGSFEDQGDGSNVNVQHGSSWATYDELPGWKIHTPDPSDDPSDLGTDAPIELQFGGTGGISAQDGNAKMEMDSHNEGGYTSSNAHVYQDIPTVSGEPLTVSFWYSPRTTSSTNDVNVFWNGALLEEISGSTPGWVEYRFEVVAGTDETTRLEFRGEPNEDTLGGYIDNVFVGNPDFDDGSFQYQVTDEEPGIDTSPFNHHDTADVDVTYQEGGVLTGGDDNEIVIGGDNADTIRGGDGDDTILGGGGDDVISGGSALDGNGEDTFHYVDIEDGDDVITFFDGAEDVINLDELFDELGIASDSAEERAGMINLESISSPNPSNPVETKITIDGHSDFSITLKNVDLGDHDGDLTAEQLNLAGIFVGDES